MATKNISLEEFRQARQVIAPHINQTPLLHSAAFSKMFGGQIRLKLENLQRTGSFKVRGASYKILTEMTNIGPRGVVAASAGNHAQGVALAAGQADLQATIVMPVWASISKQEATRAYGAEVILHGNSIPESLDKARDLAADGRTFIHPFDDAQVITGQGTLALEICAEFPDVEMIVVPIGGGGLIAGVASAAKAFNPRIRIIGVQTSACPSAFESRRLAALTTVDPTGSLADGITVKRIGDLTFETIQELVDDIVVVEDEDIARAMLMLLERERVLAEGAGAVGVAALLSGRVRPPVKGRMVLVVSGGNVDSPLLGRIIDRGLQQNGRVMRLRVPLDDSPGRLAGLLTRIAELKANVLHIYHDRHVKDQAINMTTVQLEIETRGPAHIEEIADSLQDSGYTVDLN